MNSLVEKAKANLTKAKQRGIDFINRKMELDVEDQYLFQREKGQALKRGSTPRDEEEAASLGFFNAETGLTATFLKSIEQDINWLCGLGQDYSLNHACDLFLRSTGSRQGKRLELTLGTVRDIKPDINAGQSIYRPGAVGYGFEDRDNKLKGEPDY